MKRMILSLMSVTLLSGCAQLGPSDKSLPAYVDGYKQFITQKQSEDVIFAEGTNLTFALNITGATKVSIAGIVPQRSIMPKNPSTTDKLIDATGSLVKTAAGVYLGTVVAKELANTPKTVMQPEAIIVQPSYVGPEGVL